MKSFWDFLRKIVLKICLFLGIPENFANKLVQFIQFCIVGVSNTLISYIVYLVLIRLGVHYIIASVIGFVASVTNSFYWNNKYVFGSTNKQERSLLLTFVKTLASYAATGLVLSNILLVIWIELLSFPEWLAPLMNLLVTIPINFLLNKFWAFKNK